MLLLPRWMCWCALALSLTACSDLRARMEGYPSGDTVLNLNTASSNEIADALNQMADLALLGDDWEFEDPQDPCTVRVIAADAAQAHTLSLRLARFGIARDRVDTPYYATLHQGEHAVLDGEGRPLRLFESNNYHTVFFAEGFLQALAHRCATATGTSSQDPMQQTEA